MAAASNWRDVLSSFVASYNPIEVLLALQRLLVHLGLYLHAQAHRPGNHQDTGTQPTTEPGCSDTSLGWAPMITVVKDTLDMSRELWCLWNLAFYFCFLYTMGHMEREVWRTNALWSLPICGPYSFPLLPVSKCQLLDDKGQRMTTSPLWEEQLKGISKRWRTILGLVFFFFTLCYYLPFIFSIMLGNWDHPLFTTLLRKRFLHYGDGWTADIQHWAIRLTAVICHVYSWPRAEEHCTRYARLHGGVALRDIWESRVQNCHGKKWFPWEEVIPMEGSDSHGRKWFPWEEVVDLFE